MTVRTWWFDCEMLQSALRRLPPQLDADLRQFLCELLIPPPLPLPSTSSVSQLHTEKVATEDADKLVDILQELFSQHNVHCERLMSTAANATTDGGTSLCNLANSMGLPVELLWTLHAQLAAALAPSRRYVSKRRWIPTGYSALDHCIGGHGWSVGEVVELAGLPASGKTQLCMSTAAALLKQDPEAHVMYISTLGNYNHGRLCRMLSEDPQQRQQQLSRLWLVQNPRHVYSLMILLGKIFAEPDYQLRLLIVDSLTPLLMPFTPARLPATLSALLSDDVDNSNDYNETDNYGYDDGDDEDATDEYRRLAVLGPLADPELRPVVEAAVHPSKLIGEVGRQLRQIGEMFSLTVLITNFASSYNTSSEYYQQSAATISMHSLKAALGAQWRNCVDTQIMLMPTTAANHYDCRIEANVRLLHGKIPNIGSQQLPACQLNLS